MTPISHLSSSHNTQKPRTKAPVRNIQIPEVYSQVICRYVCFLVGIDSDGVDVVGVCIGVYFAGNGSDDVVLMRHTG